MTVDTSTRVTNIGPRQRRIRLATGLVLFAAGLALSVLLVLSGQPRIIRIALIGIFLPAFLGVLQFRERTCVYLATRGQCNFDSGAQPVTDIATFTQLIRQTRSIFFRSLLYGLILTLIVLAIPSPG